MYVRDTKGGNQKRAASVPWSLSPSNVITLSATPLPGKKGLGCTGIGCSSCGGACASQGMGAIDLSTLGIGGYAALAVGLWLATKVLFTGDRAKERRAAYRKVDADYRLARDEVKVKYPRF